MKRYLNLSKERKRHQHRLFVTNRSLPLVFGFLFLLISLSVSSQTSVPYNIPIFPGGNPPFNFLGWEAGVSAELDITHHTQGQPIIFGTANTERMRILPNGRVRVGISNMSEPAQLSIFPEATKEKGLNATISGYDQGAFSHGLNVTLGNGDYLRGVEVLSLGVENSEKLL